MTYNFNPLKDKIKHTVGWLTNEFGGIRTGRATASLLDTVQVDSYGSKMPINNVASVTIEDPKTLRISPWDSSQIQSIEKAITTSNLGVSVSVDEKGLRVIFPELTGERRQLLIKLAKEKLEEAKIALRHERNTVWTDIQDKEKEGGMGEDEKMRFKADMEKIIQDGTKQLDELFEKKEKEIEL